MATIKVKDSETGEFVEIPVLQGSPGEPGQDGTSVNVIKANSEVEAITLSAQNPNNIYYWVE